MAIPSGYTPLDFVGFTDKGAYANNVPYVKNDLVHYGGDIWKCKVDNTTGVLPVDGVNWEIFIGEPTNLVERIIAPLETNPATIAYTIGRQIIYDDWLWEVIAPIAIGDTLVDYAVDPSNANIKKAPAVETQLLSLSSKAYQTDDSTETDIADDDLLPFYDTSATARKKSTWSNIIAKIKAKLGTAATKGFTTSVTSESADLVTSGGVYASEQTIKQALTTVEGKLSHRNLLDNPWFTVNQRAITFPHTVGSSAREYLFDRWKFNQGDVVGYSSSGVLTSSGHFFQPLSNEVLNGILGKTVTASLLKGDNTILSASVDIPSTLSSAITFTGTGITLYSVDGTWVLLITAPSSGMKAVKLEIGSGSTLAMDTTPNYEEELLKCQRYFVRVKSIHGSSYGNVGLGTIQSSAKARSFVSIPTVMRTTPTVSASGKFAIKIGATEYPFTNGTEATISVNHGSTTTRAVGLFVVYTTSQGFSVQQPCELNINNDGYAYVDFSADM